MCARRAQSLGRTRVARHRRPRATEERSVIEKTHLVAWIYVVGSLVLGWSLPRISGGILGTLHSDVGHSQAIAFLSAISTGMMAFTGIVFSLLFLLMQFGSTAYSPHLVTLLARNPTLVHAQGVFTGTFLYSLMALRGVGAAGGGTLALTIWVAFAWLVASIFLLLRLVQVFATLEITDVLQMLGESGQRELDVLYGPRPGDLPTAAAPPGRLTQRILHRGRPRYLVDVDVAALLSLARDANAVIRVPVSFGDSITVGTTIALVEEANVPIPEDRIRRAIVLGRDRSLEVSPKSAIRLLVDIAIRALSPAINDPTTAVRSLDQIEDLLVRLGNAPLENGTVADQSGKVRVVYTTPTWEEYLDLALAEIQLYGAGAIQIQRRLAALLALLRASVPAKRHEAIDRIAQERMHVVERAFDGDAWARDRAAGLDRQGLGHTAERKA